MKKLNKTIALFLIFAMALTINPLKSNASWGHESTNLPGTVSDGTIYALAGVAVVGLGVLAYVLIKKSKQNKAIGTMEYHKTMETLQWENQIKKMLESRENVVTTSESSETCAPSASSFLPENTLMQQVENAQRTIPVDLVVAPLSHTNFTMGKMNGVQLGVRIRF